MSTTPVNALEQDCGDMPLHIRRERLALRFLVKAASNPYNPAGDVTQPDWQAGYGKYAPGKEPLNTVFTRFFAGQNRTVTARTAMLAPPWQLKPLLLDSSLAARINKRDTPMAAIKAETLCFMERYAATTLIFTDASKLPSGETAAAIFVPSTTHAHSVRVKNTVSVHSAEVAAVQLAVDWLLQQQVMLATIFTDSLSTISALQSPDSGTKSALLSKLLVSLDKLDTMPTLAWIPGHVGIRGNDIADRTAKSGTAASTVELHTPHELKDELRLIDVYAIDRWQAEYDAHVKGAVHHVLEPQV